MLQQTRVEAAIPFYTRFLDRFPAVADLAAAPREAVLTLWSGLGYYSRARNLHRAARHIAELGPLADYDSVRSLPGVGPYTAAAISSIALGLPHAAVDGNVIRVLSRIHNDPAEVTSTAARRRFAGYAAALLDSRRPGDFNQAMMELGATVCLPRNPSCSDCPVAPFCAARAAGTQRELPVKLKKQTARDVPLDIVILESRSCVLLIRRASTERRLADFLELPEKRLLPPLPKKTKLAEFPHRIVNDRFRVTVWRARVRCQSPCPPGGEWVQVADLSRIPLTTVAKKALDLGKRLSQAGRPEPGPN